MSSVRINKYLGAAGVCSRREADRLVAEGRIWLNGRMARPGDQVSPGDIVLMDGVQVMEKEEKILLLFYKPKGVVVSTVHQRSERTVLDLLSLPSRVFPVGRLDKDSEGLLLMTNQGDLANRIMKAANYHEKEYLVRVDRDISESFIRQMSLGVPVLNTVTRPCQVTRTGRNSFRIVLTQGLNRQIRRMCEVCGCRVVSLKRIRIMNLTIDGLKEGQWRPATAEEWEELERRAGLGSQ